MARYYGIDLGTTNTVISMLNVRFTENLLQPNRSCQLESVPIYYEQYEWDASEGRFLSFFEAINKDGALSEADLNKMLVEESHKMPSVVYRYRSANGIVMLTGEPAARTFDASQIRNADDFYENTKIMMDDDAAAPNTTNLSAEDVAYHLLKTCFVSIMKHEKKEKRRGPVNAVGISYPAARNQKNYLECLKRAANRAAREVGFLKEDAPVDFFCTTQEPYAAITNMIVDECKRINDGVPGATPVMATPGEEAYKCMMVVDVGGGTTDIAVQPIHFLNMPNRRAHLPLYPENYELDGRMIRSAVTLRGDFGGADIDAMLARRIARDAYSSIGASPNLDALPPYVVNQALTVAREMKHFFSDNPEAKFFEKLLPDFFAKGNRAHQYTLNMKREEYEKWIMPYIYNTKGFKDPYGDYKRMEDNQIYSIQKLMNDTRLHANCESWSDVNCVFVTGGMSKMPELREMIEKTVMGSGCKVVYSDHFRKLADQERIDGEKDDANSMRFFDIAYGVAVYACLHEKQQDEKGDRVSSTDYRFKDFVPLPHSSIALLADVGGGRLPVELISHSMSLPVNDGLKENVFISRNVYGITVQMYTGLSAFDPHLKRHARCEVALNQYPPLPGTKISLRYNIDQDMKAKLYLQYMDAQGVERIVPMREINLDAVESADN